MTDEAPIGWAIALPNDRKVKLFPDGGEFQLEFVMGERVTARTGKPGFYQCAQCKEDFTVRTGWVC